MTAGLMGSGTEADPWLITTTNEFLTVVRDSSSGFYRIANSIDFGTYPELAAIGTGVGASYGAKVIDGDGFRVRLSLIDATFTGCGFANIHFRNIALHVRFSYTATFNNSTHYLFYRCSISDCAVHVSATFAVSASSYFLSSDVNTPYIIPRKLERVALFNESSPSLPINYFVNCLLNGVVAEHCYAYTSLSPSGGVLRRTSPLTLEGLDALASGQFSDAGWWQDALDIVPWQSELVSLSLQTIADAASCSRMLWLESLRSIRYLGASDDTGAAQATARVQKGSGFVVWAAEDVGVNDLRAGASITSGVWYLPPVDNGYVYQADVSGHITSLDGLVFSDQSITVDGITLTPRRRYLPAMSSRRSVARNGSAQIIILDNSAGGGGPVIEGDPAYLDGIVEEIHPMTGARQALANCEVVAFERRGSDYFAMGSTYSNGIGGFRLETDVYSGGDVFAFAADFPGVIFQPAIPLNVGDRIRPALANGYVYEIIQPGTAGPAEPVWWPDAGGGTEGDIGTARARARPYYQPVGHGPLKMILIE